MQKHLRETLRALRAEGAKDLTVHQNGHYKIAFRNAAGFKRTLVLGASPSDTNYIWRQRSTMRRLLGQ
jgi:hypothetical protein